MLIKRMLVVVSSLVIIAVSFIGGVYYNNQQSIKNDNKVASASEEFIIKINAKDYKGAVDGASPTFKNKFTESKLKEELEKSIGLNSIGAFSVYKGIDQSFALYNVSDNKGNSLGTLSLYLVKDNNNWFVDNFTYNKL